jgi:hypothetical protein
MKWNWIKYGWIFLGKDTAQKVLFADDDDEYQQWKLNRSLMQENTFSGMFQYY